MVLLQLLVLLCLRLQLATSQQQCVLVGVFPLTNRYGLNEIILPVYQDMVAATILAMDHFNARNPAVVEEISNPEFAVDACPILMSKFDVVDNELDKQAVVVNLPMYFITKVGALDNSSTSNNGNKCKIVIGSSISSIDLVSYNSANFHNASFTSPMSQKGGWGSIDYSKSNISLMHNVTSSSIALAHYLEEINRNYVATIYADQKFSISFWRDFENTANRVDEFYTRGQRFNPRKSKGEGSGSIYDALSKMKKTGYRTIMVVMETDIYLDDIAREASKLDMVEDYLWVFVVELPIILHDRKHFSEIATRYEKSVFDGAIFVISQPSSAKMLQNWSNDGDLMQRVRGYLPETAAVAQLNNLFTTSIAPFVYDAVISSGMGACNAALSSNGGAINDAVLNVDAFHGATNTVSFESESRGRNLGETQLQILNTFLVSGGGDATISLQSSPVATIEAGKIIWTKIEPLRFSQGVDQAPPLYDDITVFYKIPYHGHAIGFYFVSLMTIFTIASMVWIYRMRYTAVMKAAPMRNLMQVVFGVLLMEVSWYFFAMDDSFDLTLDQLGICCMLHFYSMFVGFAITYIAFVNHQIQIIENNRHNLSNELPSKLSLRLTAFLLPVLSTLVLIYVAIFDRLIWKEMVIETNDYDVPTVRAQFCWNQADDDFFVYYFWMVGATVVFGLFFIAYVSWQTESYQGPYKESSWILYAIMSQIQVWLFCVPLIFVVGLDHADIAFVHRTTIIWIWCSTTLLFCVGPKFLYIRRELAQRNMMQRYNGIAGEHGQEAVHINTIASSRGWITGRHSFTSGSGASWSSGAGFSSGRHGFATGMIRSSKDGTNGPVSKVKRRELLKSFVSVPVVTRPFNNMPSVVREVSISMSNSKSADTLDYDKRNNLIGPNAENDDASPKKRKSSLKKRKSGINSD